MKFWLSFYFSASGHQAFINYLSNAFDDRMIPLNWNIVHKEWLWTATSNSFASGHKMKTRTTYWNTFHNFIFSFAHLIIVPSFAAIKLWSFLKASLAKFTTSGTSWNVFVWWNTAGCLQKCNKSIVLPPPNLLRLILNVSENRWVEFWSFSNFELWSWHQNWNIACRWSFFLWRTLIDRYVHGTLAHQTYQQFTPFRF